MFNVFCDVYTQNKKVHEKLQVADLCKTIKELEAF